MPGNVVTEKAYKPLPTMNIQDLITHKLNIAPCRAAVSKPALTNFPVMTSTLITTIPAAFGSGNIGRLAVNIVANRLLAAGATPRYIAGTVTIDIDTPIDTIEAVADGMSDATVRAEMEWTTLNTAVKPIGPSTGVALSIFGVGEHIEGLPSRNNFPRTGDAVIITGTVGATGAAIYGQRRNVLVTGPEVDGIALTDVMRAINEYADSITSVSYPIDGINKALACMGVKAIIDSATLPMEESVAAACKLLELDPLEMPTASAMLVTVPAASAHNLLEALHRTDGGSRATLIGTVS